MKKTTVKKVILTMCDIIEAFINVNGLPINMYVKMCIALTVHWICYYDVFGGYFQLLLYTIHKYLKK